MLIMLKDNYLIIPRQLVTPMGTMVDVLSDGFNLSIDSGPVIYFPVHLDGRVFNCISSDPSGFSLSDLCIGFMGIVIDKNYTVIEVKTDMKSTDNEESNEIFYTFKSLTTLSKIDGARFIARSLSSDYEEAINVAMELDHSDIKAAFCRMNESIQMFFMDRYVAIHTRDITSLIQEAVKENTIRLKAEEHNLINDIKSSRQRLIKLRDDFIIKLQDFSWDTFEQEYLPTTYPRPVLLKKDQGKKKSMSFKKKVK